jgi:TP901 family phage tail tape measure protein
MAKKGSINLSILSTYDSKGTDAGEKALKKFASQYGAVDKATKQVKLDPVAEQLARQSIAADQAAAKLQGYANKTTDVGKKLSATVTAPIMAAGTAAFKLSTDFENAMNKVSTIADTSDVPMEDLRKAILRLSDDTGIAATDIADNVYNAISAGQKTGDAVAFVGNAAKLAKAGFTDSASALDVLTTTLNAYKLSADQTAHVSDILLQTQNKGKTTVGELSASIGKAIPTAAAFNVNLKNLAAAYATTTANGVATAESTTYIKSMLKELGDTGSDVGKIIKEKTGKSFSELMASGKTLGDALNIVSQEGGKSGKTMYDLFGSAEAASAAAILASDNSAKFSENLTAMGQSAGLTDESFNKMASTTGSMNKAINRVKNAALEFGDTVVADAMPAIDAITGGIKDATEYFHSLSASERQGIVQTLAMAAAIGPVTVGFGKLIGVGASAVKQYARITAAMAACKAGTMANGAALTTQTKIMGNAGNAVSGFVSKIGAARLGVLGLVAVVGGTAIKAWMDYQKRQEQISKATDGLRAAQLNAINSTGKFTMTLQSSETSYATVASSVNSVADATQKATEKQAELADSLQQTFADAESSVSQITTYGDVIQELANKSNLSAEDQARLKAAVDGFNSVCGTSYQVVDALNGKIADQNGQILETDEAIKKVIESKKTEARLDALKQATTELYKQQTDAANKLADAKRAQADAEAYYQQEYEKAKNGEINAATSAEAALKKANDTLNEAQQNYDSVTGSIKSYEEQMTLATYAQDKGSGSVAAFISAHNIIGATLSRSGQSVMDFTKQLEDNGVQLSDLADLTDDQLATIADMYDGSLDSIVDGCEKAGVQIPKSLADKVRQGTPQVEQAAGDMTKGASGAAQRNADASSAGAKLTLTAKDGVQKNSGQVIGAGASVMMQAVNTAIANANANAAGGKLSSTAAWGINKYAANENASQLMKCALGVMVKNSDAYGAGKNLSDSVARGVRDNIFRATDAVLSLANRTIATFFSKMKIASPSKVFRAAGQWIPTGAALGIEDTTNYAVQSSVSMADDVINAAQNKFDNYRPTLNSVQTISASKMVPNYTSSNAAVITSTNADIKALQNTMAAVLAELKSINNSMGRKIRDNAPVVVETEQQFARRVQKAEAMSV